MLSLKRVGIVLVLTCSLFGILTVFALETDIENRIIVENRKPGTTEWHLTQNSRDFEISGYASATSINAGETITFFVSTDAFSYTLAVYRLGWYNGDGGRRYVGPVTLLGTEQEVPIPDSQSGLLDLDWAPSYTLTTGSEWVSGAYLIKLTTAEDDQSYIPFTVRNDGYEADILFQNSVLTWQAYNNFGGKSLYDHNSQGGAAYEISFNRPYASDNGAGELLVWEYQMIRYLEREGYDINYVTNIDIHTFGDQYLDHKAFLAVGHDEYWSWEMRDNIEALRDNGVNLGFFAANTGYWQVRLKPSAERGEPNRTIVAYRNEADQDPVFIDDDPNNDYLTTTLFRDPPVDRPEEMLLGVQYGLFPVLNESMVITNSTHWIYAGTGLQNGDVLTGVMGYEVDGFYGNQPENIVVLGATPLKHPTNPARDMTSYMTIYTDTAGALVFATGTIQWSFGLDNYVKSFRPERDYESETVQKITSNLLNRFVADQEAQPTPTAPKPTPIMDSEIFLPLIKATAKD